MTAPARICLIDDEILVRDAMALALRDVGYKVIVAPGAAAGFDIIAREHIDVVITDMKMPGTDGSQFILQARARWPNLPIIVISGTAIIDGRETANVARDLGADATLIEPIRAQHLSALVGRLLTGRGQRP